MQKKFTTIKCFSECLSKSQIEFLILTFLYEIGKDSKIENREKSIYIIYV